MAEYRGLENVGETARKKKDPSQDRKADGQTHQDKNIPVCLTGAEVPTEGIVFAGEAKQSYDQTSETT